MANRRSKQRKREQTKSDEADPTESVEVEMTPLLRRWGYAETVDLSGNPS